MVPGAAENSDLRDHLRVLGHRKWTIVFLTLLVVAASVGVSALQTPIYQASADILLQPRSTESIFDPSIAQAVSRSESAPTEIRVLKSEPVRRMVEDRIGDAPAVSVTNPAQTDFLVVTAESADPKRAVVVANTYAQAYVDFRREQAVDDLEAAIAQLEAKIEELDGQLSAPAAAQTGPDRMAVPATGPAAQASSARQSLERNRELFATRIDQLKLAATQKTGGAQLVSRAKPATTPVRPTPVRNAVIALFAGLVLGVGVAVLREHLDDSLKTKEDVERVVPDVPVLGLIPHLPGWKDRKSAMVISITDPKSPAAEAYRSVRTSVQFLGLESPLRTLQVTSPSAAEGKSTTIANLAVAVAGAGLRVVVVDADLRRPRLHRFFGLQHDVGLTSVLLGHATLVDAVQKVPDVPGLYLLASGPVPPNPSEVLASSRCAARLQELGESCDLVLVDCPPVLPVTDASVLASYVDGTLLVVSPTETERRQLRRAMEMLGHVNAPIRGVVFNSVTGENSYGYRYRYAYAPDPPDSRRDGEPERRPPSRAGSGPGRGRASVVPEGTRSPGSMAAESGSEGGGTMDAAARSSTRAELVPWPILAPVKPRRRTFLFLRFLR